MINICRRKYFFKYYTDSKIYFDSYRFRHNAHNFVVVNMNYTYMVMRGSDNPYDKNYPYKWMKRNA